MKITHQQFLNSLYSKEKRNSMTKLEFGNRKGKFPLKLEEFHNLVELNLLNIELTELDLRDCHSLEKITISFSTLDNPSIFKKLNREKLRELNIVEVGFSPLQFHNLLYLAEPFKKLTISRDNVFVKLGEGWIYQNQVVQLSSRKNF